MVTAEDAAWEVAKVEWDELLSLDHDYHVLTDTVSPICSDCHDQHTGSSGCLRCAIPESEERAMDGNR